MFFSKKRLRGQRGFTLIELMIILFVLAVLAATVYASVGAFLSSSRLSAANTEVVNVRTAALFCLHTNKSLPLSSDELYGGEFDYLSNKPDGLYYFSQVTGLIYSALACDDDGNPNPDNGITRHFVWDNASQLWKRP